MPQSYRKRSPKRSPKMYRKRYIGGDPTESDSSGSVISDPLSNISTVAELVSMENPQAYLDDLKRYYLTRITRSRNEREKQYFLDLYNKVSRDLFNYTLYNKGNKEFMQLQKTYGHLQTLKDIDSKLPETYKNYIKTYVRLNSYTMDADIHEFNRLLIHQINSNDIDTKGVLRKQMDEILYKYPPHAFKQIEIANAEMTLLSKHKRWFKAETVEDDMERYALLKVQQLQTKDQKEARRLQSQIDSIVNRYRSFDAAQRKRKDYYNEETDSTQIQF